MTLDFDDRVADHVTLLRHNYMDRAGEPPSESMVEHWRGNAVDYVAASLTPDERTDAVLATTNDLAFLAFALINARTTATRVALNRVILEIHERYAALIAGAFATQRPQDEPEREEPS